MIANLRALAANDCLLRSAGQFHYLINVDADELVVPRHVAMNYSDMINRINNNFRNKRPSKLQNGLSPIPIMFLSRSQFPVKRFHHRRRAEIFQTDNYRVLPVTW